MVLLKDFLVTQHAKCQISFVSRLTKEIVTQFEMLSASNIFAIFKRVNRSCLITCGRFWDCLYYMYMVMTIITNCDQRLLNTFIIITFWTTGIFDKVLSS